MFWLLGMVIACPFGAVQEAVPEAELAPRVLRIEADLEALTAYPTRHTLSPHSVEAAGWIEERFREAGLKEIHRSAFSYRGIERHNVVGSKRGTAPESGIVLIGAHYDSRMERLGDAEAPAPGADDNATGVASLLEIARSLREVPTRRTIRFVAFSGEEQGLVGSRAYAELCKKEKLNIEVMINLDMVGRPMDADRREIVVEHDPGMRVRSNDGASRAWANWLARSVRAAGLTVKEGPIYGSDYLPFEAAGHACVGLFDGADREPFYHTGDDRLEDVDPVYCARAAAAVIELIRADPGD